jgi:hypothetical protein
VIDRFVSSNTAVAFGNGELVGAMDSKAADAADQADMSCNVCDSS